jgi:hypothetical protein
MDTDSIANIAPHLGDPHVLVGCVVLFFFSTIRVFIEVAIPRLSEQDVAPILHKLLDYGLIIIALLALLCVSVFLYLR